MNAEQVHTLKQLFRETKLPGISAQLPLSPLQDMYREIRQQNTHERRKSAVFALLKFNDNELQIVYIKRKVYNGKHSGQIAFVGGKVEPDESTLDAAFRETMEEIGVPKNEIELIGELTDVYIPVSNFEVYPYVGFIKNNVAYNINKREVDSIIEIAVDELLDANNLRKTMMELVNGTKTNVPYYNLKGEKLWGATAMMTAELLEILKYFLKKNEI